MCSPVLYFFRLMLSVSSQFSPDITNKRVGFSQAFPQKGLKLILDHKNKLVTLYAGFMPLPSIKNVVLQESCNKKYVFMA